MFSWLYAIALILSIFMIVYMARNNYVYIDTYMWSMLLLTPIIILGYFLQTRVTTAEGVMFSLCIIYIDSTIFLMIILMSMLNAVKVSVNSKIKVGAYVVAFAHLGLVWSCFDNDKYFKNISVEVVGNERIINIEDGELKFFHYIYLAAIVLFILVVLIYNLVRKDSYSKKSLQIYMIFLTSGLVAYVAERLLGGKHSFLPFLYVIGDALIIFNYDFLHSHNLAYLVFNQKKVVGAPGYISFDLKGRMLGYNDKALEMFPKLINEKIDRKLSDDFGDTKEVIYSYMADFCIGACTTRKYVVDNVIYEFDFTYFKVKDNGSEAGYILNIWDITEEENNIALIKEQNESLKQNNEVIRGISEMYYIIYEMDFVNDTFKKIRAPEYISDYLKQSESARKNLHDIALVMYIEEDTPKASDFFDTDKWEERLANRDVISVDCRGKVVGWTRINLVVSSRTESGGINKVLVAIENVDAEKSREYQYHTIIECLSTQYPKMWLINVEDRTMMLIRNNDMSISIGGNVKKINYNTAIKNYIDEYVDDKDKEHLWYNASLDNLIKVVPNDDVYAINYLAHDTEGNSRYYSMVFAKASEGNIVLAFRDIDEIFRKEQAKELELQEALKKAEDANEIMTSYNEKLNEEVRIKTESIVEMQRNVVLGVANMIENRDNNTGGHVKRTSDIIKILVKNYMLQYGEELTPDSAEDIILAAPMHDLGKIAIDNSILCKPGKLDDHEYSIMKTHAEKSGEIVLSILDGVVEEKMVKLSYNLARYHHERWNGAGYPEGLVGEAIPLEARIMAVADVYDALVSKRPYKQALGYEEASKIMYENMGSHFDPKMKTVFEASVEEIERYYKNNK